MNLPSRLDVIPHALRLHLAFTVPLPRDNKSSYKTLYKIPFPPPPPPPFTHRRTPVPSKATTLVPNSVRGPQPASVSNSLKAGCAWKNAYQRTLAAVTAAQNAPQAPTSSMQSPALSEPRKWLTPSAHVQSKPCKDSSMHQAASGQMWSCQVGTERTVRAKMGPADHQQQGLVTALT